jgi:hypothetical protein
MTSAPNTSHTENRTSNVVLWASAFIITALILMQAGRLAPNPAYGGMAASSDGGFSLVTSSDGNGPADAPYDLLYIIDNAEEVLYIYTIPNATSSASSGLELLGGGSLPTLFRAARGG